MALSKPYILNKLDTIDSQLADIAINVKSFGAKGDGITDDITAINNAVEYLNSLGGGKLLFPKDSVFIISSPIKLKSNIIYEGQGISTEIQQKKDVIACNLFGEPMPINSCSHITIRNMKLNGNKVNTIHPSDDSSGNLIRFNQVSFSKIENCYLENAKNNGISLYNASNDNTIRNCFIMDNGATSNLPSVYSLNGVFIEFGSSRNKIINTRISSNRQVGICVGVLDADNEDNVIKNCYIQGNIGDGIFVGDNSGSSLTKRTKIINCQVVWNSGVGIRLNHGASGQIQETIIANNNVDNNALGGIYVQDGTQKTIVQSNIVMNNTGYGLVSGGNSNDTMFVSNISNGNTTDQSLFLGTRTIEMLNILNSTGVINSKNIIQTENALKVIKQSGNNAEIVLDQSGVASWLIRNTANLGNLALMNGETESLVIQKSPSDGDVGLLLYRNKSGVFSTVQVSMGDVDSGGTGYRLLRVIN